MHRYRVTVGNGKVEAEASSPRVAINRALPFVFGKDSWDRQGRLMSHLSDAEIPLGKVLIVTCERLV